jgi:hypothetical protein
VEDPYTLLSAVLGANRKPATENWIEDESGARWEPSEEDKESDRYLSAYAASRIEFIELQKVNEFIEPRPIRQLISFERIEPTDTGARQQQKFWRNLDNRGKTRGR